MRLTLLTIALVMGYYVHAQAQDSLKATVNNWATELNINPFQGTVSFNNSINQIKVRKFLAGGQALRLAFTLNTTSQSENLSQVYGNNPYDIEEKQTQATIGLSAGMEKHFMGTKRLSPYLGFDVSVVSKFAKHTLKNDTEELTIKNAWMTYQQVYNPPYTYNNYVLTENGYNSIGVNAIAGFDFYIAKNFYLGYEFQYGLNFKKNKKVKIEAEGFNPLDDYPETETKEFTFGARLINGLRLGFVF